MKNPFRWSTLTRLRSGLERFGQNRHEKLMNLLFAIKINSSESVYIFKCSLALSEVVDDAERRTGNDCSVLRDSVGVSDDTNDEKKAQKK